MDALCDIYVFEPHLLEPLLDLFKLLTSAHARKYAAQSQVVPSTPLSRLAQSTDIPHVFNFHLIIFKLR